MHPDRQVIYQTAIRRMVAQALNEKEERFAAEHSSDTDAQLAAYLRQCALHLRYTPHAKEIVGWQYILERFGTWEKAIRAARLPLPTTPNTPSKFQLVLDEYEHQQVLYRQKKADKKQKHQQRMQKQAEQRRQYAKEQEKLKRVIYDAKVLVQKVLCSYYLNFLSIWVQSYNFIIQNAKFKIQNYIGCWWCD